MKKMRILLAAVLVAATGMTVTSCGKYEEGPGLTVLTKKSRLSGEWDIKEYIDGADGSVTTDTNSDETFTFGKDGTYQFINGNTTTSGTWEFTSDKERISTTFSYTVGNTTYTTTAVGIIVRLTNKELWLKDPEDGDITKSVKL